MCIVKLVNDSYENLSSIHHLVNYVLKDKCDKCRERPVRFYGGYNVDVWRAADQMLSVKEYYQKTDKRLMRHMIVSFEDDISPYNAYILGWQIAAYFADRFQIVFGVHEDSDNIHIHLVFNTVSFVDGLKYSGERSDLVAFKHYVNYVYDSYFNG